MRLLACLLPLLLLCGCASTDSKNPLTRQIPPGLYKFDCEALYNNKMAEVTTHPKGVHVQLLETFQGEFLLRGGRDGKVVVRKGDMSYPGLKRNFKGTGQVVAPGQVEGWGESWITFLPGIDKDHRSSSWLLRPATLGEIDKWNREKEKRRKRNNAAQGHDPRS